MLNCVMGIFGSLALGSIIDKYRDLKRIMMIQAVVVASSIILTHFFLTNGFPDLVVIMLISLAGAPMSSISVSSYQLAADVTYPLNETFGVGIMNTMCKLITFVLVMISNVIGPEKSLWLWSIIAISAIVPAMLFKMPVDGESDEEDEEGEPILTLGHGEVKTSYGAINNINKSD